MNIKHLAIGGLVAMSLVGAACGSDDDGDDNTPGTDTVLTTPGSAGITDTTVMGSTGTSGG